MRLSLYAVSVAVVTGLIGAAMTAPSLAQYEGPRGHYGSEASFDRDINGTPCGINCTRAAERRWAHRHRHHKGHVSRY